MAGEKKPWAASEVSGHDFDVRATLISSGRWIC